MNVTENDGCALHIRVQQFSLLSTETFFNNVMYNELHVTIRPTVEQTAHEELRLFINSAFHKIAVVYSNSRSLPRFIFIHHQLEQVLSTVGMHCTVFEYALNRQLFSPISSALISLSSTSLNAHYNRKQWLPCRYIILISNTRRLSNVIFYN